MGAGLEKKINQITNSMLIHALHEIEQAVQLIILKFSLHLLYVSIFIFHFSYFIKSDFLMYTTFQKFEISTFFF